MSLKLTLSPGERLYIGTTSLVVASDATVSIIIDGDLPVLREKDMMAEADATGDAAGLYLAVQSVYMSGEVTKFLPEYRARAEALGDRLPGSAPLLSIIEDEMRGGNVYRALRAARKLVELEQSYEA